MVSMRIGQNYRFRAITDLRVPHEPSLRTNLVNCSGSGAVHISQWWRCRDTADLAFGWTQTKPKDWPALNSFLQNRGSEAVQVIGTIKPSAAK